MFVFDTSEMHVFILIACISECARKPLKLDRFPTFERARKLLVLSTDLIPQCASRAVSDTSKLATKPLYSPRVGLCI